MPSPAHKEKTRTFFRPISSITVSHITRMYELYSKYYENTSLDIFLSDLGKKSGVILVERKSDDQVVGFSTLTLLDMNVHGKRVRGIFSGDTIIEKEYWGNNGLVTTFYRRLIIERLRQPFVPFYWFLISKGYKTFLLMTNNFYNYYPSAKPSRKNAEYRSITEAYCQQLFPEAFDRANMLLDFGEDYVHLKSEVAAITPGLTAAHPSIAFFEKVNPSWHRGTELPCLGSIDWESIARSLIDVPAKWLKKHVLGTHQPGDLAGTRQQQTERSSNDGARLWADTDVQDSFERPNAS